MNFYELMKYANTGIESPGMTHYDKLKALALCRKKESGDQIDNADESAEGAHGAREDPGTDFAG